MVLAATAGDDERAITRRRRRPSDYTAMLQRGKAPSVEQIEPRMAEAQDEASRRLGTLHYDVALSSDPYVLAALTAVVPPSQLVLGTDFPMGQEIGVHVTLGGLERFEGFDAAQRHAIRSTNPTRLFPRFARTGAAPPPALVATPGRCHDGLDGARRRRHPPRGPNNPSTRGH